MSEGCEECGVFRVPPSHSLPRMSRTVRALMLCFVAGQGALARKPLVVGSRYLAISRCPMNDKPRPSEQSMPRAARPTAFTVTSIGVPDTSIAMGVVLKLITGRVGQGKPPPVVPDPPRVVPSTSSVSEFPCSPNSAA